MHRSSPIRSSRPTQVCWVSPHSAVHTRFSLSFIELARITVAGWKKIDSRISSHRLSSQRERPSLIELNQLPLIDFIRLIRRSTNDKDNYRLLSLDYRLSTKCQHIVSTGTTITLDINLKNTSTMARHNDSDLNQNQKQKEGRIGIYNGR